MVKYYCSNCGSDKVFYPGWISYNPEVVGYDYDASPDPNQDDWCDGCHQHIQITDSPPAINNPEGVRGDSYSATGQTETKS